MEKITVDGVTKNIWMLKDNIAEVNMHFSESLHYNVVTIYKSYLLTKPELMLKTIRQLEIEKTTNRSEKDLLREWKAHNMLYKLGLFKKHTRDTDFEKKEKLHRRFCYYIIAPFYKIIFRR